MHNWRFDGPPVLFPREAVPGPSSPDGAAIGEQATRYFFSGDPWLYATEGDSRLHMLVQARTAGSDGSALGAIAHTSTGDLLHFEAPRLLAAPCMATRMETPQLFSKNGRWYLLASSSDALLHQRFLAARGLKSLNAAAVVFTADNAGGPYELIGEWALFPGEGCYICKVVPEADSILTIRATATQYPPRHGETGISPPIPISYPAEGGIRIMA
ncbi:MAG: hypothetical protein LBJ10_11185 [Clostridiales bacterium]|nr:hypothetical protein [Clostridiales bacterium]